MGDPKCGYWSTFGEVACGAVFSRELPGADYSLLVVLVPADKRADRYCACKQGPLVGVRGVSLLSGVCETRYFNDRRWCGFGLLAVVCRVCSDLVWGRRFSGLEFIQRVRIVLAPFERALLCSVRRVGTSERLCTPQTGRSAPSDYTIQAYRQQP